MHINEPFELKGSRIVVNVGGFMDSCHGEEDPFVFSETVSTIVDGESGVFLDFSWEEAVHV